MGLDQRGGVEAPASTDASASTSPSDVGHLESDAPESRPGALRTGSLGTESTSVRRILETSALVIAPTTLATALLYYFGWTRTAAFAGHFGISSSMFGYTPQDYLLRSVGALYYPALTALCILLALVYGHDFVRSRADHDEWRRRLAISSRVLAVLGVAVLLSAAVRILLPALVPSGRVVTPASLVAGIMLVATSVHLRNLLRAGDTSLGWLPVKDRAGLLKKTIVALLVVLGLFWLVGDLAVVEGRQRADELAASLSVRPDVVVFTPEGLHIEASGVTETRLNERNGAYRFRYEGLKLLAHSDDTYFLLPSTWTQQDGAAIVLHDTEDIRVELAAPQQ
jgi:hypothetical protein